MSIKQYLKKKYYMANNAQLPTDWLQDELHISLEELKQLVKKMLNRKSYPAWISFDMFCLICEKELEALR